MINDFHIILLLIRLLTFSLYGIDSKYIDVAEILFVSVIKPWVKLE